MQKQAKEWMTALDQWLAALASIGHNVVQKSVVRIELTLKAIVLRI